MTTQLTPAQHIILTQAIQNTSGQIDWFPDNIKGGARKKVIDAMFNRALITNDGANWIVAAEGYDALGAPRPTFSGHTGASQVLADEIGTEDPTDAEIDESNAVDPEIEANAQTAQDASNATAGVAIDDPELEAAVASVEAAARAETKTPRTRDNSKQATVIGMLKRPEGATIAQIVDCTGWQAHTVRGTFAGAFKKKLGLTITSTKDAGAQRVYRINDHTATPLANTSGSPQNAQ